MRSDEYTLSAQLFDEYNEQQAQQHDKILSMLERFHKSIASGATPDEFFSWSHKLTDAIRADVVMSATHMAELRRRFVTTEMFRKLDAAHDS